MHPCMSSTERPDIVLDGRRYFLASAAAADFGFTTDTIDYVVTDQNGLTSTRTVIIETVSE